ncbi:hypothetical protein GYMLUDRAFT_45333 [Collybiopsis luxurians FD-317 M1]|uniref:ABC transporter domain-containing protein n=1 Tax=Collybiopsis luxurians FD-317 M1 TaxID=944289 RepID=A0A0D0BT22_9AGAR|nr:hypothetical protein GYMLUDRAFT_45333 [Collybiopsis luxurians FD-317 M1]
MIKIFGWEKCMLGKVSEARDDELRVLKKRQYMSMFGWAVKITLAMKQALTASTVFSSLVVFENLQRFIKATYRAQPPPNEIGFQHASFLWSGENGSDGAATPSGRRFMLRVEDKLSFERGCLNLVTGPTGSEKASLLLALLGETHFIPLGPSSYFLLP